jgi:hypothetical protein
MKPNVVANASAARMSLFFLFKEISNGQESCLWSVRKSMTIVVTDNTINQLGLDLVLKDVMPRPTRNRLAIVGRKSKPEIQVEHIGGMFELSHIEPGDVLQSINQKICISSKTSRPGIGIGIGGVITTAAEAMDYMHKCLKEGEGKEQRSLRKKSFFGQRTTRKVPLTKNEVPLTIGQRNLWRRTDFM